MAQLVLRVNQGSAVQIHVKESLGKTLNINLLAMGAGSSLMAAHWCGSVWMNIRVFGALWGALNALKSAIQVLSIYHLAGYNVLL